MDAQPYKAAKSFKTLAKMQKKLRILHDNTIHT